MGKLIRVVTNCTKDKGTQLAPARDLYRGLGHKFVKLGVETLETRYDIDWVIMSAKHGYVPASNVVSPYNFTFVGQSSNNMKKLTKAHTTSRKRLQSFLRRSPTPELQVVGMSKPYYSVFSLLEHPPRHRTIVVGVQSALKGFVGNSKVVVVPVMPGWASEGLGTNLVGLNGKVTQLMLQGCTQYGIDVHWDNLKRIGPMTILSYLKGIHNVQS